MTQEAKKGSAALAAGLRKQAARRALKQNAKARENAGEKLERLHAEFVQVIDEAKKAKVPIAEIARLAGTNRQRIYDMVNNPDRPPRTAESKAYRTRVRGGQR